MRIRPWPGLRYATPCKATALLYFVCTYILAMAERVYPQMAWVFCVLPLCRYGELHLTMPSLDQSKALWPG